MNTSDELTDKQVENWRKALCLALGPYALIAPREQIQSMCNTLQKRLIKGGETDGNNT